MLAERLTNFLCREGSISEEEKEIVRFGLESVEGNLLGIAMTLVIGIGFNRIGDALLLWLLLFPLRKNAGGFHASTKKRCFLLSALMLILAFMIFSAVEHSNVFYLTSGILSGVVIWILAPIDNSAKKLDKIEFDVYQKRSRIILEIECGILILAMHFEWRMVVRSVVMAFFIVNISIIIGHLNMKKRITNHEEGSV